MRMTHHAWERWRERHPSLDLHTELAAARRPSKRLRTLLELPTQAVPDRVRQHRQYLITRSGVVFVLDKEDVVLTVLRLAEAKRRARALRRKLPRAGESCPERR